jgi:RimJ/RimL family protein N-acetyltransferase
MLQKDLEAFVNYRKIEQIARYQSWSSYNMEDGEKLLQNMQAVPFGQPGYWFQLAIVREGNEELAGDLALHVIDEQQIEVGFTLAPAFQGKGIAKGALKALLDFVFQGLAMHRVFAITDTRNSAAVQLLESLNFRREAEFKQHLYFKGQWCSEYQYALLQEEWSTLNVKSINN